MFNPKKVKRDKENVYVVPKNVYISRRLKSYKITYRFFI